jgi:hypothetical protein
MRIAFIGGISFDSTTVDTFLWNLKEKYPNAIIATSDTRGSEKHAAESATALGFTVDTIPSPDAEMYGEGTQRVHVETILNSPRCDVIVTMGSPTGGRAKAALEIWKRCDTFNNCIANMKNVPMTSARKFHNIAAPEKKPAPRKPRKAAKTTNVGAY